MRTRKDVWNLPAQDETLLWYGRAVAEMQQLPRTDPLSWEYQAAIHGIDPLPSPMRNWWAQCQHSSSFFLPWHRMYLLHFERIVAAHVQRLGGPAEWALPYWNYSQGSASRALPLAFRNPQLADGSPNPLYVAARSSAANAGSQILGARDVALDTCLRAPATTTPGGFFGGPPAAHFGLLPGALELTPHNAVHRQVGGWMTDPDLAALDPIFWLHHANIDRMWEVWLNRDPSHKNLTTAYWLTGVSFSFHDASGASVTMSVTDVLNLSAPALDYGYEDTSDPLATPLVTLVGGIPTSQ
jgi:tyrosinase